MALRIEIEDNGRGRIIAVVSVGRPNTTVHLTHEDLKSIGNVILERMSPTARIAAPGHQLAAYVGVHGPPTASVEPDEDDDEGDDEDEGDVTEPDEDTESVEA